MTCQRLLLSGGLFLCMALWLAACGDPPRGAPPDEPGAGNPARDVDSVPPVKAAADPSAPPPPADDDAPAFRTAAECGRCHTEIYAEWKASYHGRAMVDPLFLELSAEVNKEECIRCHAPVNLRDSGFETPIARSELREDAISCLSCHQSGRHVAGPHGGLQGACRPIQDPAQSDVVKMCFVCHNQHDTGNEWLRGPYAKEGGQREEQDCLDCHMPEVERPLVVNGPVRKGRRHTWFGGHSMAQLEKAAKLDVVVEPLENGGHRFKVLVTNVGAGHAIPTDARHRSFDTYILLRDEKGVLIIDPTNASQQSRAHLAKFRKFYRGSGKKDTQIGPLETASTKGEGLGYVDVPEARAGTGEAWLVYRLTPRDVLNKKSLEAGPRDDIGRLWRARVVIRQAFEYGGK